MLHGQEVIGAKILAHQQVVLTKLIYVVSVQAEASVPESEHSGVLITLYAFKAPSAFIYGAVALPNDACTRCIKCERRDAARGTFVSALMMLKRGKMMQRK